MSGPSERARRRSGDCDAVAAALPAWVAGEGALEASAFRHMAQCLRCQADAARYRRMLRALHDLKGETELPPPGVLAGIIARLDTADLAGPSGRDRWALLGAAAGAGALGAAAVLVWAGRRRSALP